MRRTRKSKAESPGSRPDGHDTRQAALPVATFRPPRPRTVEWADSPNQEAIREIDLSAFHGEVQRILLSVSSLASQSSAFQLRLCERPIVSLATR